MEEEEEVMAMAGFLIVNGHIEPGEQYNHCICSPSGLLLSTYILIPD